MKFVFSLNGCYALNIFEHQSKIIFQKHKKQCVFGFVLPVKIRWIYRNSLCLATVYSVLICNTHPGRFLWTCPASWEDPISTSHTLSGAVAGKVWECHLSWLVIPKHHKKPWFSIRIPSWNWGLTWWLTWFNHKTTMRLWSLTRFKHWKGTIYIIYICIYLYMYMYIANILIKHTQSGTQKEDIYGYLWIFKYI